MDEADKLKEELIQLCDRFTRLLEGGDKLCQIASHPKGLEEKVANLESIKKPSEMIPI